MPDFLTLDGTPYAISEDLDLILDPILPEDLEESPYFDHI